MGAHRGTRCTARESGKMMDHPNIAKIHDAGATATGRQFFVMKLVRGIPVTKYCDDNHSTRTARLELFIRSTPSVLLHKLLTGAGRRSIRGRSHKRASTKFASRSRVH